MALPMQGPEGSRKPFSVCSSLLKKWKTRVIRPIPGWVLLLFICGCLTSAPGLRAADGGQATALPRPQEVMKAYPNEPERVAALMMIRDAIMWGDKNMTPMELVGLGDKAATTLRELVSSVPATARQAAIDAFNQAIKQSIAEERRQSVPLDKAGLTQKQRLLLYQQAHTYDAMNFHVAVLRKFLPTVGAQMNTMTEDDKQGLAFAETMGLLALTGICVLITPWVLIRFKHGKPLETTPRVTDAHDVPSLPETLCTVQLPKLQYAVELESGQVIEEKTWSETHVDVSTSGGQVTAEFRPSGIPGYATATTHTTPLEVHTNSTSVQKDRVWIRTPTNEQSAWTFTGGDFLTRKDHLISLLAKPTGDGHRALIAYNHTTKAFEDFGFHPLRFTHRLPVFWLWLLSVMVGTAGGLLCGRFAIRLTNGQSHILGFTLLAAAVAAIIAALNVFVLKLIYQSRRNRVFRKKYLPAYRQFFEQITPELFQCFESGS